MKNRLRVTGMVVVLLANVLIGGTSGSGDEASILQTHYYLISIGEIAISLPLLVQTAQKHEFAVIDLRDEQPTFYRGTNPTAETEAVLLEADLLLYVDQSAFLLRVSGEDLDYGVRPGEVGYTLVLFPHRDLPQEKTLLSVLNDLQRMGIVGAEVEMEGMDALAKAPEKTPKPPEGVSIDSSLYGLAVSSDWFFAAASLGLARVGLRAEVVAEKLPGATIPEEFRSYIISETEGLAKLLIPIYRLVDLAKSSAIGYLRPPYQPHPVAP